MGTRDDQGRTPLHWAAVGGHDVLARLLDNGDLDDRRAAAAAAAGVTVEDYAPKLSADDTPADFTPLAELQACSAITCSISAIDCWATLHSSQVLLLSS